LTHGFFMFLLLTLSDMPAFHFKHCHSYPPYFKPDFNIPIPPNSLP
jgi:hypothetical protein